MSNEIGLTTAGAGSGKTTKLTQIIQKAIERGECRAEGIIATTFTNKAAGELVERVRRRLFEAGQVIEAQRLDESLLGTVHSICTRVLGRFAFEAGISPQITVIDETDARVLMSAAIEEASSTERVQSMERLASRLCQRDDQTGEGSWKREVGGIVRAARENGIEPARLPAMAETSIAELAAHLPAPTVDPLEQQLSEAIRQAFSEIEGNGDATGKTAKAKQEFEQTLHELREGRMSWAQWWRVAKADFGKKSADSAQAAQEIAGRVEEHPTLRDELAEYVRGVFAIAGQALAFYQRRKEERGWLDFGDLESRTLALLSHADVIAVIKAEFDLLLVDEFQDTSPLQLALFLELAELIRVRTVWVGDVKQAIYGFRGSDPELMNAAVKLVRDRGGMMPPLSTTYRAQPELAAFLNAVFVPAFGNLDLAPEEVALHPARSERAELPPPIERWLLSSGQMQANGNPKPLNKSQCAAAIAEGVARLLAGGYSIEDRHSKALRPLTAGDVAVLCRSNDAAAEVAGCLIARGIAVTRETPGLLATPEVCLALAGVRRLLEPGDSLAAAEIIALDGDRTPEQWLNHRLEWIAQADETRWGLEGDLAHPALLSLEEARKKLVLLTPLEALDTALSSTGVLRTITAWGPTNARAAQRRANIEALRGLAIQYESRCATAYQPATVAGFLLWCAELQAASADCIAADASADAICVLTWHGAKGLEWPVVICSDLEKEPRARVWDQVLVVQEGAVDPHAPLASRRLRFWPWPFGGQSSGVPLLINVENSAVGQRAARRAMEEELRLLYVALTRARDVLVLPFRQGKVATALAPLATDAWLTAPTTQELLSDGTVGAFRSRSRCIVPPEIAEAPQPETEFVWFPAPTARTSRLPATLQPHAQSPVADATAGQVVEFHGRLSIRGKCDEASLGNGLHALIAFDFLHPASAERETVAARLLTAHGIAGSVDAADALTMCNAFREEIERRFAPKQVFVEVPFTFQTEGGQVVHGTIDLLLETAAGVIVIDHKTFLGRKADWPSRALSHSGQLALYRAVCRAMGHANVAVWVHFATGGGLVEVSFTD
jgi:ATP-dependent helicase/nuclease subunit A